MGVQSSSNRDSINIGEEVNFDHFQILRAIGKGSFGKVCIVQKKDTKQMYAMKYMHKSQCVERDALKNVLREMEILTTLEHPFLVNLWFCFQDEEDLFMVSDLLLGGDLRYHISQDIKFSEDTIHLYAFELGLALDYLRTKHIIHRDIKPDNILLDEEGHAHITDFNIATVLEENQLATSMSGTKPYIAPEIFLAGVDECLGYSYPVDWWSLGVTLFEILARGRPFDIHSNTSVKDVKAIVHSPVHYPSAWSESTKHLIAQLLCTDPSRRLSNAVDLTRHESLLKFNMDTVLEKQIKPGFTPPRDHLNCDPTFELEEMIVEARPLHKKKKRLAKQRSLKQNASFDIQENDLEDQLADFRVYNRERELIRRALEKKENDWEAELIQAMNESTVTSCEVKPHLSFDNATSDSTHASSTLLNLPPSIILDQRRRSSCKLSVSPLSVQTRLAASPQRNKEVKPPNDTAANCNKPKKKILNRQQTLQRLPYINVNEIITVDSTLLEKSEKGSKLSETFNSFHIGETIEEESGKNENAQNDQSPMSLANVLIEIEKLKERSEKDEDEENSAICDTQNEKQNSTNEIDVPRIEVEDLELNVPVDELNSRDSKLDNLSKEIEENERKELNELCNKTSYDAYENTSEDTKSTEVYSNSNKEVCDDKNTTNNEYNYHELTRFTVTKSISRTDENKTRNSPTDKNTPSQLEHTIDKTVPTEHHVTLNEKEFTRISLKDKIETGVKIDQPADESHRKEIRTATENVTIVNITYNSSCKENMHADEKFLTHNDSLLKISAQIKTSTNTNSEVSNGCSESKSVTKNQTEISKNPQDPSQLGPLALPNISVSHETSSTSNSKTPADPQKSPMKSPMDRSPNRSPCRSPKLGDIPTRSVLKNSLYRTDSTDSTKSMEKSPKKSFKVSFSCDVEDNEARPKSPSAAKMAANSKSLDNDANEPSPSKKDKKKKKEN